MHDAFSTAYDTFVTDDPDDPAPLPTFGRVSTEDLVAHIIVLGQRHRRTPDLSETACGVPIHSEFVVPLREQLTCKDGGLCAECFTPHELIRAVQNDNAAAAAAEADEEKHKRESDERLAKRWKRPTSQGDR